MQNKRILIASWTFYPAWSYGGIAKVMFDLASRYTQNGYHVDCITTDIFDSDSRYQKTEETVNGMRISFFKNVSNLIANKLKFPLPWGLRKWLDLNIRNYDIVHIADFRNIFNFFVYRYCKRYNIPYIVSPFGTIPYELDIKFPVKKLFDLIWSKRMLLGAKYVTVQTESEFDQLVQFWVDKKKIKLIPLMIDYDKFRELPEYWSVRKKYNIPSSSKVLLFVGRIHEYKATDMMVDCFSEYQRKIPDSYLIIVGRDDGYETALKRRVEHLGIPDRVLFAGPVYYPENLQYYVDADIYFMAPSHWEETSTASLEALACGTPVVVTEQASIPFIDDYNAGFIVPFEREKIVSSLLACDSMDSESCKRLIGDHFDVRSIQEEFLKLYFS